MGSEMCIRDRYKELRDKVMGQLPVIYVSFRGVEGLCFHHAVDKIITKIALLYKYFLFLADSRKIPQAQKDLFLSIYNFCIPMNLSLDCNINFVRY